MNDMYESLKEMLGDADFCRGVHEDGTEVYIDWCEYGIRKTWQTKPNWWVHQIFHEDGTIEEVYEHD